MRILSFNLRVDVPVDGIHYWKHRIPLVVETIHTIQADVIGLQEVSDTMADDLFPLIPEFQAVGDGRNQDLKGERVSILFKKALFELKHHETFWLSDTPYVRGSLDVEDGFPRICTVVELLHRATQQTFRVMNVHFSYRSIRNRNQNTETLLEFYTRYEQKQRLPTLLSGDFNAEFEDMFHRRIEGAGFIDAMKALSLARRATYHEFKGQPGLSAIDFIYGNEQVKFHHYDMMIEKQKNQYASDHYPIFADVTF